ncbi:HAMP domain-containing protein [Streptomyces sp. ISL-10]|uniref:HAMP domain-containing protein n=1 Tax=Streptomyces sp. ISL-10 TaxID=2819172 RepID=UPI001BEA58B9|nr:HAMP domain-containing protein [Streptomyces sp. ISL-10]MBT2364089.1 HAMP domain-containing protein [Streptomyces sp. ISL-10]
MSLLGGIRPPIAVLSVLLLALAGITALSLGRVGHDRVPKAVLTSQQHFAEDGAVGMRASIDESVTDLARTTELFNAADPVPADAVLDKLGNVYQKWLGTAVVEISSGRLLAARGENVPLTAIDRSALRDEQGLAPRMVRLPNGETRLLSFGLLHWEGEPQKLIVASSGLKFPGISLGGFRAIAVIDQNGRVLSQDGVPEPEQVLTDLQREEVAQSNKQLKKFAAAATEKAKQHPIKSKEPGSGGFQGVSGSLIGGSHLGDRSIAGYATLAAPEAGESTVASSLGLTVVAMVKVAEDTTAASSPLFGVLAAGALLLIGGVTVALLIGTVQRPLIRLFLESRRLTRGDLARPVTVPRRGEAARIGEALERLRHQLLGEPTPATDTRRRRFGSRSLLAVCGVLLLVWCAPLLLLLNRAGDTVVVPQQIVNDQRERTDTLADRVRRSLNEGHADLLSVATLIGDRTQPSEMTEVLERTANQHLRYESLYVLDADGRVLAETGGDPRSPEGESPSDRPIRVLDDSSEEPVVVGTAEIPGRRGAAVVGEFRIDFINLLLKRPGLGVVRVVDTERRIVAGNTGYRAFQGLPGSRLDALVEGTNQKVGTSPRPSGVLYRDGGDIQIAAAAPFTGGGAAESLGWTVVSWQPASRLAIAEYHLQNRTVLAGLLGVTAATACLGWLFIVVVRPLRALAGQAEALADGDRRTVLYPRHHDEVGAVVRSLELIRQQLPAQQRKRDDVPHPAGRI